MFRVSVVKANNNNKCHFEFVLIYFVIMFYLCFQAVNYGIINFHSE